MKPTENIHVEEEILKAFDGFRDLAKQ